MKTRIAVATAFVCGLVALVSAVTEQWNITLINYQEHQQYGGSACAQIVADGKGGCVVLYPYYLYDEGGYSTNGWKLLWVDKKQQTIYEKQFLSAEYLYADQFNIAVESCNGKQLTYMYGFEYSVTSTVVVVDAKGKELVALATGGGWFSLENYGDMAASARFARQVHSDKKGVFAIVKVAENVYRLTYSTFK